MRKICPAAVLLPNIGVVFLFLLHSVSFSGFYSVVCPNESYPGNGSTYSDDWGVWVKATYSYDKNTGTLKVVADNVYGIPYSCSENYNVGAGLTISSAAVSAGYSGSLSGTYCEKHGKWDCEQVENCSCSLVGFGNVNAYNDYHYNLSCSNGRTGCNGTSSGTVYAYFLINFAGQEPAQPPCDNFTPIESAAQTLLVAKQAECSSIGGEYSGMVVLQENGGYCVEDSCEPPPSSSSVPSSSSSSAPPSSSSSELSSSSSSSSEEEDSSSSSEEEVSSSSDQKDCFDTYYEAIIEQRVRESGCILERKYPNFDINDKYCIVGGCNNESSSSSDGAYSSSSGGWWGGGNELAECPDDFMSSRSYFVDNKIVYAYGNDAYNASGQYLGNTDKVIYSKIPSALARDKVAVKGTMPDMKSEPLFKRRNSGFSGSASFLLKTSIGGFVDAWHSYDIKWETKETNCMCNPPKTKMVKLYINMSFETEVKKIEHKDDPLLMAHENKHIRIYESSLGNVFFTDSSTRVNFCERDRSKWCPKIEEKAKLEFEKLLTNLINAQNKFDNEDKNNVSHERISLDEKLKEMRKTVKDSLYKDCWGNNGSEPK